MMNLYDNPLYREDLEAAGQLPLPWEKLAGKTLALTGATGLLGSFLVDTLMEKNRKDGLGCTVIALGRSRERAMERFSAWEGIPCSALPPAT